MAIAGFEHCLDLCPSNYFWLFQLVDFRYIGHSSISMHLENHEVAQKKQNHILLFYLFFDPVQPVPYQMKDIQNEKHLKEFNLLFNFLNFQQIFCSHFQAIIPQFCLPIQLLQFFLNYEITSFHFSLYSIIFIIFLFSQFLGNFFLNFIIAFLVFKYFLKQHYFFMVSFLYLVQYLTQFLFFA